MDRGGSLLFRCSHQHRSRDVCPLRSASWWVHCIYLNCRDRARIGWAGGAVARAYLNTFTIRAVLGLVAVVVRLELPCQLPLAAGPRFRQNQSRISEERACRPSLSARRRRLLAPAGRSSSSSCHRQIVDHPRVHPYPRACRADFALLGCEL